MNELQFPTQEDISRIYSTSRFQPFRDMNNRISTLLNKDKSFSDFVPFIRSLEVSECLWQLHERIMDVAKSYVMLCFFYEKGIPDEEWYISPGRKKGSSIEYFPHFEPHHHEIKQWFDFYSDTFYYQLFSVLDMVGHFCNVQYELGLEQRDVTIGNTVRKLSASNPSLHRHLSKILDDPIYLEAKRLRNDIAHNFSPHSVGLSVTRERGDGWGGTKVGERQYTPSAAIAQNAQAAVSLLQSILNLTTDPLV